MVTLLLVSAFLGGYYVGRLPGAPDVFGWAKRTYQLAAEWGGKAARRENRAAAPGRPALGGVHAGQLPRPPRPR